MNFAAFHLSAGENVWPHIKFVNEGECLTSWAVSPDITLDKTETVFCLSLWCQILKVCQNLCWE